MNKETIIYPEVIERPCYYFNDGQIHWISGRRSLINRNTNTHYSIVSDKYKTLPYHESVDMVENVIQKNPEFGNYERNIIFLNDGGRMLATYRFIDHEISIGKNNDLVNPQIILRRSYDTSWGFSILFGAYRRVCANGLTIGEKVLSYRHKHTSGINLDFLESILNESMHRFSTQTKIWEGWMDRITLPDDYETIMSIMAMGKKHQANIEKEIEISSNVTLDDVRTKTLSYWMFFNIIAQYVTHRIKSPIRQQMFYDRMQTAFKR